MTRRLFASGRVVTSLVKTEPSALRIRSTHQTVPFDSEHRGRGQIRLDDDLLRIDAEVPDRREIEQVAELLTRRRIDAGPLGPGAALQWSITKSISSVDTRPRSTRCDVLHVLHGYRLGAVRTNRMELHASIR